MPLSSSSSRMLLRGFSSNNMRADSSRVAPPTFSIARSVPISPNPAHARMRFMRSLSAKAKGARCFGSLGCSSSMCRLQPATWAQRVTQVSERRFGIVEEHDPETREDEIKALRRKRNCLCIGGLKPDVRNFQAIRELARGLDQ
jgi:hypothetical protein